MIIFLLIVIAVGVLLCSEAGLELLGGLISILAGIIFIGLAGAIVLGFILVVMALI